MMTGKKITNVLTVALGLSVWMVSPGTAQVEVGNLRNDYVAGTIEGETTDNTTPGQWSYYSLDEEIPANITLLAWDTAGGNYESATDSHTDGHKGTYNSWPLVDLTTTFGGSINADELFVHPGHDHATYVPSGEEFLLLRWTAGAGETGTLNVSGNIRATDTGGDGIGLTILVNGVSQYSSGVVNTGDGVDYNFDTAISAGQTVDFIVDHGAGENLFDDASALSAVLTLSAPSGTLIMVE